MAAPDYVPVQPQDRPRRAMQMPPPGRWAAARPADFAGRLDHQPVGPSMGYPGPDLGFALKLARSFRDRVKLQPGEHWDDVEAGCVAIAMRRASLFGRAPVVFDLELAFGIWGYLSDSPPADLVEERRRVFEGAAHDYWRQRAVVDRVPESTLRRQPKDLHAQVDSWRDLLVW